MEPQDQHGDGLMPVALAVAAVIVAGLVAGRNGAIAVGTVATIVSLAVTARPIPHAHRREEPDAERRVDEEPTAAAHPPHLVASAGASLVPAAPAAANATAAAALPADEAVAELEPRAARAGPGAGARLKAIWAESWSARLGTNSAPAQALARIGLNRLLLTAVVGFALAIRLASISSIPGNITADEKDNTEVVIRIQETGKPGWFGLDWKPAPAFSMHVVRLFMAVFGTTPLGLRMASIVMSTAAIVVFVAIARRVVEPIFALAAATLLASGRWYLHFSRSGWENVQVGFYALLAVWALTIALETRRYRWFVVAGSGAALGLYGYFSGRLVLPALLAYLPFAWWFSRPARASRSDAGDPPVSSRRSRRPAFAPFTIWQLCLGFGIVAVVAVGLFLPQLRTIQRNWDYFNNRVSAVYILKQPRPYLGETSTRGIIEAQARRTVDTFILQRGGILNNGRYSEPGAPLFDRVTGLLVVAGFVLGLWRWRQTALWWLMLLIPLFATQVLSAGTPDAARAVPQAPFFYLFVALALNDGYRALKRTLPYVAITPLLSIVFLVSAANVHDYFRWIQSPDAIAVRAPSLTYDEYPIWIEQKRCEVRNMDAVTDASGHVQCVARSQ